MPVFPDVSQSPGLGKNLFSIIVIFQHVSLLYNMDAHMPQVKYPSGRSRMGPHTGGLSARYEEISAGARQPLLARPGRFEPA